MTYGLYVLMIGTVAMDFGTRKAASVTGFIDCFGYIGAVLCEVLVRVGWLIITDEMHLFTSGFLEHFSLVTGITRGLSIDQ